MAKQPSDKCDFNNGVNFESTAPPADGTDPLPGQSACMNYTNFQI